MNETPEERTDGAMTMMAYFLITVILCPVFVTLAVIFAWVMK